MTVLYDNKYVIIVIRYRYFHLRALRAERNRM